MKDQVIKFLGDLPKSGSEQFNQALELLRKSKNHDAGKVRYYNTLGLSPDRLESLLYDLKQLHNVTDIQLANAKRKNVKLEKVEDETEDADTAKNLEVKDPVEVKTENKTVEPSEENKEPGVKDPAQDNTEASAEGKTEAPAQENAEPAEESNTEAAVEEKTETTVEEKKEAPAQEKTEDQPVDPFKQKLADFDLSAEKYNSIKSFAAEISNVTGEDPADQKAASLKSFIEEAKKKFAQS